MMRVVIANEPMTVNTSSGSFAATRLPLISPKKQFTVLPKGIYLIPNKEYYGPTMKFIGGSDITKAYKCFMVGAFNVTKDYIIVDKECESFTEEDNIILQHYIDVGYTHSNHRPKFDSLNFEYGSKMYNLAQLNRVSYRNKKKLEKFENIEV